MPSFNLLVKAWFNREYDDGIEGWTLGKPTDPPDTTFHGAIQFPKQSDPIWVRWVYQPLQFAPYSTLVSSRQLLLPKRTVCPWPYISSAPDDPLALKFMIVKVPSDLEHWYYVSDWCDIGRGHPNEFRVASIFPVLEWFGDLGG